jgi:hypothetical protein
MLLTFCFLDLNQKDKICNLFYPSRFKKEIILNNNLYNFHNIYFDEKTFYFNC